MQSHSAHGKCCGGNEKMKKLEGCFAKKIKELIKKIIFFKYVLVKFMKL